MKWLVVLIYSLCLCCSSISQPNHLFIDNVSIVDVCSGNLTISDVEIESGRITKTGVSLTPSAGSMVIDGSQKYLMPGLIDAHIHLFQSGGIYTRPDAIDLTAFRSYQTEIDWLREHATDLLTRYLRCGITSVMDIGGPMTNYDIRRENEGNSATASLYVTGPLISTYQPAAFQIEDPPIIKVSSSEEAIALVQKQIPYKPDFIKIWYITLPGQTAESTYDIVAATIAESHKHGLRVAVHATQLNTAKLALKAGADVLVHSVQDHPVDADFISLIKSNDAVYIPTLIVSGNYGNVFSGNLKISPADFAYSHPAPLGSIDDLKHLAGGEVLARTQENEQFLAAQDLKQREVMAINLKLLQENKIKIATGTDAGNIGTFHASSYFTEIAAMKNAGLSNAEILCASTVGGAYAIGRGEELGIISPGKVADLLLLNANPMTTLEALKNVYLIIKEGQLINPDTLIKETPENLVQQQVNGYNARNMDAFLAPYSDDFEIYDFPDKLRQKGKDKIGPGYAEMFENTPLLHCEIVNRVVFGSTVVDQERVTGLGARDPLEALAIYKIENGKIAKVYFVQKE